MWLNIDFVGYPTFLLWVHWTFNTFASGFNQAVCAKTTRSHVALHGNISGSVSARELFKDSKDLASLVVYNEQNFLVGGADFSWPTSPVPGTKPLHGSILLKFLLEARLQSGSLAYRLGPGPGNMSQNGPKSTSLMTSLTKNLQPPTKKII